jgi:tetratricopeptide (TPR) repeat protein
MAAVKTQKKGKGKSLFDDHPKPQGDLAALVEQFKENPALYIGAAVFLVVCLMAGILYRAHREAVARELYTNYAAAMNKEDPTERLAALEPLLDTNGPEEAMAEVVYVTAETAYWAHDYEKAKSLYERVRTEFSESPYVPDAVEGLGYIAEDNEDFDAAASAYQEISQLWPTSFTARRQPLNLARVEEKRGNLEAGVQLYREQTTIFPESNVAREAQAALDRLGKSNPDLFTPDEVDVSEVTDIQLPSVLQEQPVLESVPGVEKTQALELKLDALTQDSAEETPAEPVEPAPIEEPVDPQAETP